MIFKAVKILKLLTLTVWIFCAVESRAQWTENFDLGWNNGSGWMGDISSFTEDGGALRSDNIVLNGTFFISRPIQTFDETEWQVLVNLKFNTSSVNYTDIFLWSDSSNLTASLNSYYVRVGNTRDEIALYRSSSGGAPELMIDGTDNLTSGSDNVIYLKVIKDVSGKWTLYTQNKVSGIWNQEGEFVDTRSLSTGYFGIFVKQSTSSFFKKHFFDDLYIGPPVRDTISPYLTGYTFESDSSILINFNEPVYASLDKDSVFPSSSGLQVSGLSVDNKALRIIVSPVFVMYNDYQLQLRGIRDTSGNQMRDTTLNFRFELPRQPVYGDLIITEIMADPDPVVQLPPSEYIELYNRSGYPIDLTGIVLKDPGSKATLPPYILKSGQYLILCSPEDVSDFEWYGEALGVTGFPSLNNSGDSIQLLNASGQIIDRLHYSVQWYKDATKSAGGFSLELIDTAWQCDPSYNWKASMHVSGGTPGRANSVAGKLKDTIAPGIESFLWISKDSVVLGMSELPDTTIVKLSDAIDIANFNIGKLILRSNPKVSLTIIPADSFEKKKSYSVAFNGFRDCSANRSGYHKSTFSIPEPAVTGDIVINEVLFNPVSGGSDYVELFNNSAKVINLNSLYLAVRDTDTGFKSKVVISETPLLLYPETYRLIAKDNQQVISAYPIKDRFVFTEVKDLPSLPDDEGNIYILNEANDVIDGMNYREEMHHPSIENAEGVSLEKIKPEQSGWNEDNWHSAATASFYGTPGLPNSQFRDGDIVAGVTIGNSVFSPDGDGYYDVLLIEIEEALVGNNMNAMVLDIMGRKVKELAPGSINGSSNLMTWDGTDENQKLCRTGTYVIYVEIWGPKTEIKRFKKVVTLAAKLND